MAVTFFGAGTAVISLTAISIPWPANHQINDIGVAVIEQSGLDTTIPTPSGWVAVQTPTVAVATTAGSKFNVFVRRATSTSEANLTIADQGDHQLGRLFVFRGVDTSANLSTLISTSGSLATGTSASVPSLTTTIADSMIVMAVSRPNDQSSTTFFGVPVNANLTGLAEAGEAGTQDGNGGGFTCAYGTKATVGATGASTISKTTSTTSAVITFVLPPTPAGSGPQIKHKAGVFTTRPIKTKIAGVFQ